MTGPLPAWRRGGAAARGAVVRRGAAGDRGAGSVLVLGVVAAAGALLLAVGLVAGAYDARGRARTAADLAALAAAAAATSPGASVDPCARAAEVAARNGADLGSCTVTGPGVVDVAVRVASAVGDARAAARAGPVTARDA
ncbi:Rv3654c family TadE-like protein [Cellulomonas sp. SLBN-39]|uniref:Rv3654c family TadE-like protein n=1 Tax=Cellulomonas sp. SLBN-39 TaxID=2768446 RepID=UPI00117124EC|nr:Rv3654c family TadE-like protein [Cellulomonas sp. SLBN-39]TQL03241.1 secretion/DNA translocation related TadE-like protein [Cellulomonas sp. SLBN-39]